VYIQNSSMYAMSDLEQELQVKVAEIVGLEPTTEEPREQSDTVVPEPDFSYLPAQTYYGIEEPTDKQIEQLKTVWEYFSKDSEDEGDTLKKIRASHLNLVQPEIGQTKLSQLADYVKIVKQVESTSKQKQAYERLVAKDIK
jgi:hypothetical protein